MDATRIPTAEEQPLMTVAEAGAFFNLKRAAAYEAARRGVFPTIKAGRRIFVPTAAFRSLLGLDPDAKAS